MDKLAQLKEILAKSESEANKLYNKNNKSAAARLRGHMQTLKVLAQEIRVDALEYKKSLPVKGQDSGSGEDADEE